MSARRSYFLAVLGSVEASMMVSKPAASSSVAAAFSEQFSEHPTDEDVWFSLVQVAFGHWLGASRCVDFAV